jgi:four helix bundle protein
MVNSERGKAVAESKPRDITERTFEFAERVVSLCRAVRFRDVAARVIVGQLVRAGTSVGANVEEAQASHSRADFAAKCSIACKEARETRYWLRLLAASGIVSASLLAGLLAECDELVAILITIVKKAKQPVS